MKKLAFLFSLALMIGLATSCSREEPEGQGPQFDVALLQGNSWTIDQVVVNSFGYNNELIGSQVILFGQDEEGGICTFSYDDAGRWIMNDNGTVSNFTYELTDDRIIRTNGGGTWGIRELDDNHLEMTLQSEGSNNPCDFSNSGAVYYLSRNLR